ncbi:MAG: hypothetical protein IJU60_06725 [Acholeplasmatales bacterium]|nr:hypothetical protein [Acholeplasmatales bacterium]
MRKTIILFYVIFFIFFPLRFLSVGAEELYDVNNDYKTFVEIIMSSGKLLKNFTDEELEAELAKTYEGVHFYDVVIEEVNKNVKASYISNTLFSVENKSATDVKYDVSIQVETNNTVSFSTSGSISASGGFNLNKVKAEAAAKASVEYSEKTTKSIKEKKEMNLVVEANSRAIIYLTGELTISNGVISIYGFFYRICSGGYEVVTLNSQYARLEKDTIWRE